ncbi:hypothetical protein ACJIZ3_023679 [Penstemon smallii]|uniref:J domain-containing protein n=1 Tax=Penstemon smallii TaxID=265156 RepID=A0ABD3TSQ2_9LAMI
MECNKDEAVRSKAIAENKILLLDVGGAKKFALKAQTLFPNLDGISQFLQVINIYVVNEKKINGEVDYYKMFGVDPFADEEILKKQYKKLALSLHPDKNKSVGADGAFKIISQAWSVLSDKDKRRAYNLKLNIDVKKTPNQRDPSAKPKTPAKSNFSPSARNTTTSTNPATTTSQSVPTRQKTSAKDAPSTSQQYNSAKHDPRKANPPASNTSSHNRQKTSTKVAEDSKYDSKSGSKRQHVPSPQKTPAKDRDHYPVRNPKKEASKSETFWTSCNRCRIPYKYLTIYLNKNIRCPHCQQSYIAAEITNPNVNSRSSGSKSVPAASASRATLESLKAVNKQKNGNVPKKS